MKIFLVRHGRATKSSEWTEADELRPLDSKGERQARGIQTLLEKVPLRRICSSPALRCRKTVARLAADHVLNVEVDPRIGADSKTDLDVSGALHLLEEKRGAPILICASRSLIVELLGALGVASDAPGLLRCQKGSIWALERRSGVITRTEYIAPLETSLGERRAVLDVGSTSMSLLIADVEPEHGRIQSISRSRVELRLGASANPISPSDCDRIVKLGRTMRAESTAAGSSELLAVATASLRNAANGAEVTERLNGVLEAPLRVLSGPEEAQIVYHAVRQRLGLDGQRSLTIDLGGGSMDLALGVGEEVLYAAREPLGVTQLHAECVRDDPMKRASVRAIRKRVRSRLEPHIGRITERRPIRCAAAGGTARALAKLVLAKRGRGNAKALRGLSLLRSELESTADELSRATHAERIAMPGMRVQRADLLPTGAIVLAELLELLGLPELTVSDWGLREGVLLEAVKSRSGD